MAHLPGQVAGLAHAAKVNARFIEQEMERAEPDLTMTEGHAVLLRQQAGEILDHLSTIRAQQGATS